MLHEKLMINLKNKTKFTYNTRRWGPHTLNENAQALEMGRNPCWLMSSRNEDKNSQMVFDDYKVKMMR